METNTKDNQLLQYLFETEYVKRMHKHLPIMDVEKFKYIRVGRDKDGGYVMIDDFKDVKNAYSCGINDDVSWDKDFVNRRGGGISIYMYDHTIDRLPEEHKDFHFFKTGITGIYDPSHPELETIPRLIAKNGHQNDYNMILKMDIEGYEWEVLENIDVDSLNHFSQIVIEMHWLIGQWFQPISVDNENKILFSLDKLNSTHQLVYIHGNNASPILKNPKDGTPIFTPPGIMRAGLMLPNTIECTYLRKDKYKFKQSKRFFPTQLDRPCDPGRPDINLGFWHGGDI